MALGKPTWEDHPWPTNVNWRGHNAVDGLYTDRSPSGAQCVITDNEQYSATWRVDLGKVAIISYINIYYRTDNFPRKIHGYISHILYSYLSK